MIRLTWRQHRQQALAGAIGHGLLALFLIMTHAGIASTFRSTVHSRMLPVQPTPKEHP